MAEALDPDKDFFFRPSGPMSSATTAAATAQPTDGQPRHQQQEQRRLHSLGSPSMQEDAEMDGAFKRSRATMGLGLEKRRA